MNNNYMVTAQDVVDMLGISKGHAYKIIRQMKVGAFVETYFRDKQGELKERSIKNKRYMIERHILPYFENKSMNEITPADIIQWQNKMREAGCSQTYLRML